MATATKTQTDGMKDATAQAQQIAERLVETSKKAAGEYLTLTEKAAQSVVGIQRQRRRQIAEPENGAESVDHVPHLERTEKGGVG